MFFYLNEALNRKFVDELRTFWSYHPKFRDMVDSIQGKFSFRERPQRGIVIKTSGGSHNALSADNYKGMVQSYVHKALLPGKNGLSVEWVREDSIAIQKNNGYFPSLPGVYYLDVQEENGSPVFYIDPLLDVYHEQVAMSDPTTGQLQHVPHRGSPRIYEMPSKFLLVEGVNYTLVEDAQGNLTGGINLTAPLVDGRWLQGQYRYIGDTTGPHPIYEMQANNEAIPGVVLAFGRRFEAGDQLAVIVEETRRPAALEYGGRWEMTVEFDVIARDVHDQREINDWSIMYLFAIARPRLSAEGIEVLTVSPGGEAEEVYDDTGDDYFYTSNFSISVETEWHAHVPLSTFLRYIVPLTQEQYQFVAGLPDDALAGHDGNIQVVEALGLQTVRDPFFKVGRDTFEMIK